MARDKLSWNNVSANANAGTGAFLSGSKMLASALDNLKAPLDRGNKIVQDNAKSERDANTGALMSAIQRGENPELTGAYDSQAVGQAAFNYKKWAAQEARSNAAAGRAAAASKRAIASDARKSAQDDASNKNIDSIIASMTNDGSQPSGENEVGLNNVADFANPKEQTADEVIAEARIASAFTGPSPAVPYDPTDDINRAVIADAPGGAPQVLKNINRIEALEQPNAAIGEFVAPEPVSPFPTEEELQPNTNMTNSVFTNPDAAEEAVAIQNAQEAAGKSSFKTNADISKKVNGVADYLGEGPDITGINNLYGAYDNNVRSAKETILRKLANAKTLSGNAKANAIGSAKTAYDKDIKQAKKDEMSRKKDIKKAEDDYKKKVVGMKANSSAFQTFSDSVGLNKNKDYKVGQSTRTIDGKKVTEDVALSPRQEEINMQRQALKRILDDGVVTGPELKEADVRRATLNKLMQEEDTQQIADGVIAANYADGTASTTKSGSPKAGKSDLAKQLAKIDAEIRDNAENPEQITANELAAQKANKNSGFEDSSAAGRYSRGVINDLGGLGAKAYTKVDNAIRDVADIFRSKKDSEASEKAQQENLKFYDDFYSKSDSDKEITAGDIASKRNAPLIKERDVLAKQVKKIEDQKAYDDSLKTDTVVTKKKKQDIITTIANKISTIKQQMPNLTDAQAKQVSRQLFTTYMGNKAEDAASLKKMQREITKAVAMEDAKAKNYNSKANKAKRNAENADKRKLARNKALDKKKIDDD